LQLGVFDAFSPVVSLKPPPKGKSLWKQRLIAAIGIFSIGYLLWFNAPDVDQIKDEALKAHESLLDYLVRVGISHVNYQCTLHVGISHVKYQCMLHVATIQSLVFNL
jgi:hypothetical protein